MQVSLLIPVVVHFRPIFADTKDGGDELAQLRREVDALRSRNFPVLNEALKGLRKRHAEYRAEVDRLNEALLASETANQLHASTLPCQCNGDESCCIPPQLTTRADEDFANLSAGDIKSVINACRQKQQLELNALLGSIEWNLHGEAGESKTTDDNEQLLNEEIATLRADLEHSRDKAQVRFLGLGVDTQFFI